jgi:putative ABC transport system permease protein
MSEILSELRLTLRTLARARRFAMHHLEAAPGVDGVGFASNIPFADEGVSRPVRDVDRASDSGDSGASGDSVATHAERRTVSPNLFQLLDMPLLRGRTFTAADGPASSRVAIVNQRLASRLAAGGDVLGRRVRIGEAAGQPPLEIVGVVADARSSATSVEVQNEIYIPSTQGDMMMIYPVVRSPLESGAVTATIRRAVSTVAPELPLPPELRAASMEEMIDRALAGPRFSATLMSAFSAMGLLVAVIGLFGLVTYSVSQRRQELGIRAALGARPGDLLLMAMRSALLLTALGIATGLSAGAWLTRFVERQLYGVEPLHAPTFVGAAILMLVAAGLAAYLPARRAVQTDPLTALRHE